jgi:hypothetical protein
VEEEKVKMNAELEQELEVETHKSASASEPEPEQERALTVLTLRQLVAEQLAGWMDAGVEYTYEDGDANPPLIYLYDALECPTLHRELDRVVAECEIVTFVCVSGLGLGFTPIDFAGGSGDGTNSSSSSSAASNRQANEAEAQSEAAVAQNATSVGDSLQRQPPQLHIRFADGGMVWIVPD